MRAERFMTMRFGKMSSKRGALLATVASAAVLLAGLEMTIGPAAWAIAAHDGEDMFSNLQTVSDEKLAAERGKFMFGGLNINLGATIQTLVHGQIALLGKLNLNNGIHIDPSSLMTGGGTINITQNSVQTPSGNSNTTTTPVTVTSNNQGTTITGPGGTVQTPGLNINLPNGSTGAGVVVTNTNGTPGTTFAGTIFSQTGAMNVIANNANNRSIVQQTQLTVTIGNFVAMQQQLIAAQAMAHVVSSIQGALRSFGH